MKKILLSIVAGMGFFGYAVAGNGTLESPYTVDDIVDAKYNPENVNGVYVEGYIVGTIPENASSTLLQYATFTAENASNTNFVMASAAAENDYNYCIAVQLPAAVRNALSVQINPDNIGHKVILHGNVEKYCGAMGLKSVDSYEWVGEAPTPGGGTGGSTGGGSTTDGYLTSGLEPFTVENVTLPEELSYVWSWDAQYGAKASAFYNSTNYAAESYLISPAITLDANTTTATFSQALNFLNGNNRADFVNVLVREGNGDWNVVNVSAWPAGTDWGFVDDCVIDLSAYAGKTIQLAFRYTSTSSCAPTWEVKRVVIGGTASGGDTPSTPTQVMTVTEALAWINAGNSGNAQVKGYITSIEEISTSYGNATYNIGDAANSSTTLKVYRGYYLNGDKFTSEDQIKVGDLVVVEGNLELFYSTPEVGTGSKIISINGEGGSTGGGGDTPGTTPETPVGESVTYNFADPSTLGITYDASAQENNLTGMTLTNGVTSIKFENNGGSTEPRLWNANGNYTMRFYKDNVITVSVAEGYNLTGIEFNGTNLGIDWSFSNGALNGSTWTPTGTVQSVVIGKTATGNNPTIKTMTVYYADASGVDGIVADDSEAVYFNLQGVRVNNPENGIYIKVVNGKSSKVLVK